MSIKLLILLMITPFLSLTQTKEKYMKINFRSPLGIPLILAGNFAELRSNHFHTGIDIKTLGAEGQRIYSIEDGYVSRMKISPWGYGLVIYIDHYNGLTSVYAHCQKFNSRFDSLMYEQMKLKKVNTLDAHFSKDELKVKKGDLIAISGNTGGSVAPHLHFEIRETVSEKPLNPLLFNFKITDTKKPEIRGLKVYSLNEENFIIPGKSHYYKAVLSGSKYILETLIKLDQADFVVNGKIGFALDVIDRLNAANNVCGIYSTSLTCNSNYAFDFNFEKLDFSTNRKINGHTDVYEFKKNRRDLHKLFANPITSLGNYNYKQNGLDLKELKDSNQLSITAIDAHKNTSHFKTTFYYQQNAPLRYDFSKYWMPNKITAIRNDKFEVFIPQGSFFEPLPKDFKASSCQFSSISLQYHFGSYKTPTNNKFKVRFSIMGIENKNKIVICHLNSETNRYYSLGGKLNGDWLEVLTKGFGDYFILTDTIAPKITRINFKENSIISSKSELKIKIEDNLSGIQSYEVYINDEFIPSLLSPRRSIIKIPLKKISSKGNITLIIKVKDAVNNESTASYKLIK